MQAEDPIEDFSHALAVPGLAHFYIGLCVRARANDDVVAFAEFFVDLDPLFDRRGQVGVGEENMLALTL